MDGSALFAVNEKQPVVCAKRKKSRGQGILAWKALLDWNEFNMSKSGAKGIN